MIKTHLKYSFCKFEFYCVRNDLLIVCIVHKCSKNEKESFALAVITLRVYKETACLNAKVNDKVKIEIETN